MAKGKKKGGQSSRSKKRYRDEFREERWEWAARPLDPHSWDYVLVAAKGIVAASLVFGAVYKIGAYVNEPTSSTEVVAVKQHLTEKHPKLAHKADLPHTTPKADVVHTVVKKDTPPAAINPTVNDTDQPHKEALLGETAFVSGNDALIRETPKLDGKVLGTAVFGTSIDVVSHDGRWIKIHSSAQNIDGWVEKVSLNF